MDVNEKMKRRKLQAEVKDSGSGGERFESFVERRSLSLTYLRILHKVSPFRDSANASSPL